MTKYLSLLILAFLWNALGAQSPYATNVSVLVQSEDELVLKVEVTGFQSREVFTERGKAILPHFQDGKSLLQFGNPDLPKLTQLLQLPKRGQMKVEVLESHFTETRNILIAPSKGNVMRTENPGSIPFVFGNQYKKDGFYPGEIAELQTPFIQRDIRGAGLWIYPLQYNSKTKTLRCYHEIILRISKDISVASEDNTFFFPKSRSRIFDNLYRKLYLNSEEGSARTSNNWEDKMLVIAPESYVDGLKPLVAWKRQAGTHTTVVTLSKIGGNDAESVRQFIKNYYQENEISYVLLVGDETQIQSEMRPSGSGMYSCDNCFGYINDEDHIQDILVGRLHASNLEQLDIMVTRIMEYEKTPFVDSMQNWFAVGMASASNEGSGFGDDGQSDFEHANEWKANHLADGYETYWEFYDGDQGNVSPTPGHPSADQIGNPPHQPLVDLMNENGVSLYNYTGHGWEQGFSSGNFSNEAVAKLRNHERYPIVIGVACCAGNFTNGECLGEALQRAGDQTTGQPWGSIAAFLSSDFQSWSPPMEGQDGMNQYLVDADGVTLFPSIGGMAAFGNTLMIVAYGEAGEVMADFWNPFADPSTLPRTAFPLELSATHSASTFIGSTTFTVDCQVEGAQVGLYWNGQTLASSIVENGQALLHFEPLDNLGELLVTVTQFNYVPYQQSVVVAPSSGPFVVRQSYALEEVLGNGNDLVDFGELLAVHLNLINAGLSMATDIKLHIHTQSPWITLLEDEIDLGDLDPGQQSEVLNAFTFVVEDTIPNGYQAEVGLRFIYNDTLEAMASVLVTLNAPVLEITELTWSDSTLGGNSNFRMENGEVVQVILQSGNIGGANSDGAQLLLTSDSPWISISGPDVLDDGFLEKEMLHLNYQLTIASNAPIYAPMNLTYTVVAGDYSAIRSFGPFWLNPIVEDFESDSFSQFPWNEESNYPWITVETDPYLGTHCAESAVLPDNAQSDLTLSLNVIEDGFIQFARKVSSEPGWDFLLFYIDEVEIQGWSGELDWQSFSYPISSGMHTLRWTYQKDEWFSEGADLAWVDDIYLPLSEELISQTVVDPLASNFSITPNPAIGTAWLNWKATRGSMVEVELFSAAGQLLGQYAEPIITGQDGRLPLDLSHFTSGMYLVSVTIDGSNHVLKLAVVK